MRRLIRNCSNRSKNAAPAKFTGKLTLSAAATLALIGPPLLLAAEQAKSPAAPAAFNNACRTCHSIKEDDHRIGPSLHKIFGGKAGTRPGFSSSGAMKNSGVRRAWVHSRWVGSTRGWAQRMQCAFSAS